MPEDHPSVFCIRCGTKLAAQVKAGEAHPTCPNCRWVYFEDPKVAVAALITTDNKVLLVRRAIQPETGKWSLPAGFLNAHEDIADALRRECQEETGLRIKVGKLCKVFSGRQHPNGADILLIYYAEVMGGTLAAGDDADQVSYFPLDNLPLLAFSSTVEIIHNLRSEISGVSI